MLKRILITLVGLAHLPGCGCSPEDNLREPLTCTVECRDFIIRIEARGTLEASKSHILSAPKLSVPQMKIAYLVPEGTAVKKGEIVAAFEDTKFRTDYETALRELDNASADIEITRAEQEREMAIPASSSVEVSRV